MSTMEKLREEFRKNPDASQKELQKKYKTSSNMTSTARKQVLEENGGVASKPGKSKKLQLAAGTELSPEDMKREFVIDMLLGQVKQLERMVLELKR